jgi:hypothetical protein
VGDADQRNAAEHDMKANEAQQPNTFHGKIAAIGRSVIIFVKSDCHRSIEYPNRACCTTIEAGSNPAEYMPGVPAEMVVLDGSPAHRLRQQVCKRRAWWY